MSLENLFSAEVMRWRYTRALICMTFLQAFLYIGVCSTYRTLITDQIWNPVSLIKQLFYAVVKPTWIFNLIFPTLALIFLTRVHIKSYSVICWIPQRRWEYLKRLLSPGVIVSTSIITLSCTFLLQHYASLADPSFASLATKCDNSEMLCVNHKALILILVGIYLGIRFSVEYFINNGNLVTCTPEQPTKIESVKALLNIRLVRSACLAHGVTFSMFFALFAFYLCFGAIISQWVAGLLVISDGNITPGWMIWNICCDVKLIVVLYLTSSLLATVLSLFLRVFNLFITEHLPIPISETGDNQAEDGNSWRLCHTLLSNCYLLQYLSFLDFNKMAHNSGFVKRRHQIFLISDPGGHPHNWQGVLNPSLNLIRRFSDRLKRHNCPEDFPKTGPTDVNKNVVAKSVKSNLISKFDQLVSRVKRYPIFCYFLADLPDVTNRQIFSEARPVIWSLHGLGQLVASSLNEDRYGVVQRNIPEILTTIVQLQNILDKVSRVTVPRRGGLGCGESHMLMDIQLRKALRLALRTSLYTITHTFGDTICEIDVSGDVRNKIQSYLAYKEG